jgi:urease subunit gamma
LEGARDGRSVVDLMEAGRNVLEAEDVMEGVAEMLRDVQVEATFPEDVLCMTTRTRGSAVGVIHPATMPKIRV